MFILRTIFPDHTRQDQILGSSYQLIRKSASPEQFTKEASLNWPLGDDRPMSGSTFALIIPEKENVHHQLDQENEYWIMMSTGESFARIR